MKAEKDTSTKQPQGSLSTKMQRKKSNKPEARKPKIENHKSIERTEPQRIRR